ncbi:tyrosine-type recombinase/integrase [Actinomadura xylanilytica]|uniref:tyrosine-type recombinase/integrase n=1 Tax=Actinomadura xylanilytica TaxID=887459 RepID=UPI00255A711D|nr:tyrosine-type recombinase/integrase [Actinomadura xylanilytica]MDL4770725.1 tyrosine-type recombinase/integrase [Actinomadura xylanilytica]
MNAHLTAIDDLFRRAGIGPAAAKRQDRPSAAPRALDGRDLTRYLRACERAALRDRAIAFTEMYAGTRGGETVALDLDDLRLSAKKGTVIVRFGKGGRYREIPAHPKLLTVLQQWLTLRATWPGSLDSNALFLNHHGGRLSVRGAYAILVAIADHADLDIGVDAAFTPHALRHTAGTTMVRAGTDIVIVAEILGQSLETTRRYSLPTQQDKEQAVLHIPVDE